MNLTRCENGHFYDADQNASCPHCNSMSGWGVTEAMSDDIGVTVAAPYDGMEAESQQQLGYPSQQSGFPPQQQFGYPSQQAGFPPQQQSGFPLQQPESGFSPLQGAPKQDAYFTPASMEETGNSFQNNFINDDDDDSDGKTISLSSFNGIQEPVVGWLVCIEGEYIGQSFELKSGVNFIGRSTSMDIVLTKDKSVSRDKHAVLLYEPKKREFLAMPGESRQLSYVNNDVVLNAVKLCSKDVISVGNTKLIFVPLCGEDFSWDEK